MKKKKAIIRIAVFLVLLVAVMSTGFQRYTADYYCAAAYELQAEPVEETDDYIVYGDKDSAYGFIFYPGAKVEETAYEPVLAELAEAGICCVVVKMPCHLAVLKPNAAKQVMEEVTGVEHWYLGGHSLGGAMAAGFAAKHEEELEGLILLAAYPTKELKELPVLSIYGSEDEVLSLDKYQSSIALADVLTERIIEGGNHAGFGNYGEQKGDGTAQIPDEEQWQETVDYILDFLRTTEGMQNKEQ